MEVTALPPQINLWVSEPNDFMTRPKGSKNKKTQKTHKVVETKQDEVNIDKNSELEETQ